MTIYEANRRIKEIENKLQYLYEIKQLAFESTQPKAMKPAEVSVQSSHKMQIYTKLDYSIDEIEPEIKTLKKELETLEKYVKGYYEILEEYDPIIKKIITCREEYHMTWDEISIRCGYSERACRYKYQEYKRKI